MSTLFLCIKDKRTVLTSDRRGPTRLVLGYRHDPNIVFVPSFVSKLRLKSALDNL